MANFALGTNSQFSSINVSTQFRGSNDTLNNPSFAWSNDLATGFYLQNSNVIGAAIAGVNAITIGSNIGIDTLTPQFDLDVNGIIRVTSNIYCGSNYSWPQNSNTRMYLASSNVIGFSTGGSNHVVIGSNVGVGTSNPSALLHVTGATTVLNTVPTSGLVSYYPFDGNGNDTVGVNNLSTTGTVTYQTGKSGQAVSFSNNTAGGTVNNKLSSSLNLPQLPVSFSFWVNPNVINSTYQQIVILDNTGLGQTYFTFQITNANVFLVGFWTSSFQTITTSFTPLVNTWYHIACTISSSGVVLYVNGSPVLTSLLGATVNATNTLTVGGISSAFSGMVDDLRIYNKLLSVAEINLIYQNQVVGAVPTSGLITYYPFDGNVNDTIGANNLTTTGAISYIPGKIGTSVNLVNNPPGGSASMYLSKTSINTPVPFSASLWIYPTVLDTTKQSYLLNWSDALILYTDIGNILRLSVNGSSGWVTTTAYILTVNTWYHITMTVSSLTTNIVLGLTVNGGQTVSTNSGAGSLSFATNNLHVGTYSGGTIATYCGYIDDIRIYNRVLTGSEINLIYQNQVFGNNINADSRLGIGLANPQYPLDVVGNAAFTGNISAGNLSLFRNRIINGNFIINQRLSNSTAIINNTSATYVLDRFSTLYNVSSGALTVSKQTLSSSTDIPFAFGHQYSMRITATTACALAIGSYIINEQRIEGYNIADLRWGSQVGSPITVSLWVKTNAPSGSIITLSLQNIASTFSYLTNIYITTTNTWQYVSYTVPPPPSGSVWNTTNTAGIRLEIGNVSGSTFQTSSLSTWVSGNYPGTTFTTNVYGTLNNYIECTGVQVEKGTIATPFEFRPYQIELQLCQRYFVAYNTDGNKVAIGVGGFSDTSTVRISHNTPVPMRAVPTVYNNSTNNYAEQMVLNSAPATKNLAVGNASSVFFNNNGTGIGLVFPLQTAGSASQSAAAMVFKGATAGSSITFSAEL